VISLHGILLINYLLLSIDYLICLLTIYILLVFVSHISTSS